MKIILASASPRRAKILKSLNVGFDVVKTNAPEISIPGDPVRTVTQNALAKGAAVGKDACNVLSADTIVWMDHKIYGKPRDLDEARTFLRELSGRTHTVFTGVAFDGKTEVCRSDVRFKSFGDDVIAQYIALVNPLDRAGAYDIDVSGGMLIDEISGEFENVMGLPVAPLKKWGIVP